jgi:hypothetical protein
MTTSPLAVARDLGLPIPGGQVTWDAVVDLAAAAYWTNRKLPAQPGDGDGRMPSSGDAGLSGATAGAA